jgi:hypothetical protein
VPVPVRVLVPVPLFVELELGDIVAVIDAEGVCDGVPVRLADCEAVRD